MTDGEPDADRSDGCFRDVPELFPEYPENRWTQLGLSLRARPEPGLYAALAATARAFLGDAGTNFFFMHKPPGLRVRFEFDGDGPRRAIREAAERWVADGLVAGVVPSVYEPEYLLFGGAASMEHVHRLFTIDSLAWSDYFSRPDPNRSAASEVSLSVLRTVFEHLGIVGWEHRDVWDRIRRVGGRTLPEAALAHPGFRRTAESVRELWSSGPTEALTATERAIVDAYERAAATAVVRWRREYFETDGAVLGPREAAAYLTIFHWNRAALSSTRQAVITESLARAER